MSRRWAIRVVACSCAAGLIAGAPVAAHALCAVGQADPWSLQTGCDGFYFALGASVGLVEGTATETAVYYPNGRKFKLSELTWDLKDAVMAGMHGSLGIGRRVRLNAGLWLALTEGNGTMIDRDWNYPDGESALLEQNDHNWTDESRHPDTSLDSGTIVDLNLNVLALQAGSFSLRGIVGYKNDTWNWSARGGTYVYTEVLPRDFTGSFPAGMKVITYRQQYSIPYAGVGANWTRPDFQMEAHLLFSPLVTATDSDYHVLRGVLFEGSFNGGMYVGIGLNAAWAFTPRWYLAFGVELDYIPEINGDVTITGGEGTGFYGGGGGVALSTTSATLRAGYRF